MRTSDFVGEDAVQRHVQQLAIVVAVRVELHRAPRRSECCCLNEPRAEELKLKTRLLVSVLF